MGIGGVGESVTSANDNIGKARKVREGFVRKWSESSFQSLSTDEALARLSEARNTSSKSANKFMIIAAAISALYFLRLHDLAADLKLGEYSLAKIPFGLFLLASLSLVSSCVALIRIGDSRAYDRQLLLACEQRYTDCDCQISYLAFPNEYAWGEPFSQMMGVIGGGIITKLIRFLSLTLISLFLLFLIISPIAVGYDFVSHNRSAIDPQFVRLQDYLALFLLAANIGTVVLVFWARIADRD